MAGEYADYPNDPRQSSLMTWWNEDARRIGAFIPLIKSLEEKVIQLDTHAKAKDLGELPNINNIMRTTGPLQTELANLRRKIEETEKIICSHRIPVSLERFEKWYRRFSLSQLSRWLILEWGLPVVLSLWALYLVFPWKIGFSLDCFCIIGTH